MTELSEEKVSGFMQISQKLRVDQQGAALLYMEEICKLAFSRSPDMTTV